MKPSTLVKTALVYAVAALASGVFYREFTKINDFNGITALGVTHVHLFALGTLLFLVLAAFALSTLQAVLHPAQHRPSFLRRHVLRARHRRSARRSSADAAIAGMAGLSHIALAVSIVLGCLCVIQAVKAKEIRAKA